MSFVSIQSIQKSTTNSPLETRKQVSQWMAEDLRVKTINQYQSMYFKERFKLYNLQIYINMFFFT